MKAIIITTGFVCLLAFAGCKSDVPNDIPKWLKKAITELKRTQKYDGLSACVDCPVIVEEWKETTTGAKLYAFEQCDFTSYMFYSSTGERLCWIEPGGCNPSSACNCGSYNWSNFVKVRNIWTAKCS